MKGFSSTVSIGEVKGHFPALPASGPQTTLGLMLIAWTTVARRADAESLAEGAVELRLAACVQIEGPVLSCYRWAGKIERTEEFRLCFKFLPEQAEALAAWVQERHPYETPEWIVIRAADVGEKYLSWMKATSSTPPL
jgi:periplasmic divalent cation tolerance protein